MRAVGRFTEGAHTHSWKVPVGAHAVRAVAQLSSLAGRAWARVGVGGGWGWASERSRKDHGRFHTSTTSWAVGMRMGAAVGSVAAGARADEHAVEEPLGVRCGVMPRALGKADGPRLGLGWGGG